MPPMSMAEKAYDHLCNRMYEGSLRPGDLIDRRQVAESLGSSLAPVSEALKRLEYDGLIQAMPRRCTRVPVPKLDNLKGQLV